MKNCFIIACCLLFITGCSKEKAKISGKIVNAADSMLYLEEVDVYNTVSLDSVKLTKSGRFSFKFREKVAGFYQLRINPDKIIVLFPSPGEHLNIQADAKNIVSSVQVSGSDETEQITKLIKMLGVTRMKLDSVARIYENAPDDTVKKVLESKYNDILEKHRRTSIEYLLTHYNSLSSVYAIYQQYAPDHYVFYKIKDLQYFKILSDSLAKYHPKSRHTAALKSHASRMLGQYKTEMLLEHPALKVNKLPEIKLPDYSGDTVMLSSLKERYVLLSFWTYTSQACVANNIEMKNVYNAFRNRGFEIYQVAFDNSVNAWQKAVQFDELPWISVIESGNSTIIAGNYNIQALPANYLIDNAKGSIIGKNLTPGQLRARLQELYN